MSDSEDLVDELVARCIELKDAGEDDPLARACAAHPELESLVRERLEALRRIGLLSTRAGPTGDVTTPPLSAPAAARAAPRIMLPDPESGRDVRSELEARPDSRVLGKYLVGERIGGGGVGDVARGCDLELNREVAIKFLRRGLQHDPDVVRRFVEEAQIGAQLQHPGIVPVYDLAVAEGQPFFAMKLIRGRTLRQLLAARADPGEGLQRCLQAFLQVCHTIAYAHVRGVIHRDLKPDNVMVGRFGEVQVVDWGFGKVLLKSDAADVAGPQGVPAESGGEPAPPVVRSVAGSVFGTPSYMAPEQARGQIDRIDTRTDVFGLGGILCEILTGEPPYVLDGLDSAGREAGLVRMAAAGELGAAFERLAGCGADPALIELCRRCLAVARADRPDDAGALAKHIEAFIADVEERARRATVRAAVAHQRQRLFAAAAAAVATALGVTLWQWRDAVHARSEAERLGGVASRRADEIARQSEVISAEKGRAEQALQRFRLTRLRLELDELIASQGDLRPAWPDQAAAIRDWIARGDRLVAQLDEVRAGRDELRAQALPASEADLAPMRAFEQTTVEPLRARLRGLRHAAAVRAGTAAGEPPPLAAADAALAPDRLAELAWQRVAPAGRRKIWGEEAYGLALARRLMELEPDATEPAYRAVWAWALFCNGRHEEALAEAERVHELAGGRNGYDQREMMANAVAAAEAAGGTAQIREVEAALHDALERGEDRRRWRFADAAVRFLHDLLQGLVMDLERFADPRSGSLAAVRELEAWADGVQAWTVAHPHAKFTWAAAAAAVRAPDGEATSALYAADPDLELVPQLGLVPLGPNPRTKLWEFYHLRSAWDPGAGVDPGDLPIPERGSDGWIAVGEDTGIVFVLLPGGAFYMGSPETETLRTESETENHVELRPFFVAAHEMTQAQWRRLTGANPSRFGPGRRFRGMDADVNVLHPVENIDWHTADRTLRDFGLRLPTEAQWEYACRAGTTTRWWCGSEPASLQHAANLTDQRAKQHGSWAGDHAPWDDGFVIHAPVGSLAPNPFGLFDVHGNVREWCADWFGSYTLPVREGDGLRAVPDAELARLAAKIVRGGSFDWAANFSRSASRNHAAPEFMSYSIGVRPARPLLP